MAREAQNIKEDFYAGDSKQILVTVYDQNDNLFDLAGCEVSYAMWHPKTEVIVLQKSSTDANQIEILNPTTNGVFAVNIKPTDTVRLNGEYRQQASIVDGSGNDVIVMTGRVMISKSFARRIRNDSISAYMLGT